MWAGGYLHHDDIGGAKKKKKKLNVTFVSLLNFNSVPRNEKKRCLTFLEREIIPRFHESYFDTTIQVIGSSMCSVPPPTQDLSLSSPAAHEPQQVPINIDFPFNTQQRHAKCTYRPVPGEGPS